MTGGRENELEAGSRGQAAAAGSARQELERSLKQTKLWVKSVNAALRVLQQDERRILERFYIRPVQGAAERLSSELGKDVKTIYSKKDRALYKFTVALYGLTEN